MHILNMYVNMHAFNSAGSGNTELNKFSADVGFSAVDDVCASHRLLHCKIVDLAPTDCSSHCIWGVVVPCQLNSLLYSQTSD